MSFPLLGCIYSGSSRLAEEKEVQPFNPAIVNPTGALRRPQCPPCPVGVDALPAAGLIDHLEQKTSGEVLAGCGDVLSVTSCRLPSSVVVVVAARYLLLLTSPGDYDQ